MENSIYLQLIRLLQVPFWCFKSTLVTPQTKQRFVTVISTSQTRKHKAEDSAPRDDNGYHVKAS